MYHVRKFLQATAVLSVTALLLSCGSENGKFRFEGRLRHLNQGEFLVYSTDGGMMGIDTIPVREGRFSYEREILKPATFVIVFPNNSEQPVFAKPGAEVTIKGDATHLKELVVRGTAENSAYTELRKELNDLVPPDVPEAVEKFILENLRSPVSKYLLQKYFVQTAQPDYSRAARLAAAMLSQEPDNAQLRNQRDLYASLKVNKKGGRLPAFSATDVNGRNVTQAHMRQKVSVIGVWATWNYASTDMVRRMRQLQKKHPDDLALMGICVDGRVAECKRRVERDSLLWPNVCDGMMFQTALLGKFGMTTVPSNIILDRKGRIVEKNVLPHKLQETVEKYL